MRYRLAATIVALGAVAMPCPSLLAQGSAAPAASPASGPSEELKPIVASLGDKIKAGKRAEADFAGDIAKIDALLAKYAGQKTDEVAQILVLKATLYLRVFEDYGTSLALLKQMQSDFPATKAARDAGEIIPKLELAVASQKIAASLKPGAVFPVFSEQDINGNPLKLEAYRGHVVLVDFWATWCGPCVAEFPNVLAAYAKYHPKGFEIVGISLDNEQAKLAGFIKENKVTWPQFFDGKGWENKLSTRYGVVSIPESYLLDPEGKIIAVGLRGPALDEKLASLLGK